MRKIIVMIILVSLLAFSWLTLSSSNQIEQSQRSHEEVSDFKSIDQIHNMASKGHTPLNYRELWEALRVVDGEGDNVRLIYSRELRSKALNGGSKGDWNREHVWPR